MAELKDVMAYLIQKYPDNMSDELSNARLTKMCYLADWHSTLNRGSQITQVKWYFDNYGPFVWDVQNEAEENPDIFRVSRTRNMYGGPKKVFSLAGSYTPNISDSEKASLDHIVEVTKRLYWNDFIKLVYATHPIASSERYSYLDLTVAAKEYAAQRQSV